MTDEPSNDFGDIAYVCEPIVPECPWPWEEREDLAERLNSDLSEPTPVLAFAFVRTLWVKRVTVTLDDGGTRTEIQWFASYEDAERAG